MYSATPIATVREVTLSPALPFRRIVDIAGTTDTGVVTPEDPGLVTLGDVGLVRFDSTPLETIT